MLFRHKLQNTLRWLCYEPRHAWLCVLVCALAILGIGMQRGSEPTVRLVGLLLQLCGIVTVAWGIIETRQFFGMQSPVSTFTRWLARFPLRRGAVANASVASVSAGDACSARAHTSWPIDPDAPIDQRVSILERNLPLIQDRISGLQVEFDRSNQALKDQLKTEGQQRLELSDRLQTQLKTYGTGGLHISAIGAVWLFLGAVFGTASPEIAAFMR